MSLLPYYKIETYEIIDLYYYSNEEQRNVLYKIFPKICDYVDSQKRQPTYRRYDGVEVTKHPKSSMYEVMYAPMDVTVEKKLWNRFEIEPKSDWENITLEKIKQYDITSFNRIYKDAKRIAYADEDGVHEAINDGCFDDNEIIEYLENNNE